MNQPHWPGRSLLAAAGLTLALGCNTDITQDPPGGPDLASNPACGASCPAPLVCSKAAGAGCIMPGTCGGDPDCETGHICAPGDGGAKICVIGGRCGGQKVMAEAVPPNLLIVLDRSCSMRNMVGGQTKWALAVDAIKKMTTTYRDRIRYGLTLFPDKVAPDCGQDRIPISVAPGNETKISDLLTKALSTTDANYPSGPCVTNIDTAMKQAAGEQALKDATRANYVLLVTDGAQAGCNLAGGDAGTTTIITDLYKNNKVATFVLGFGAEVDGAQLNIFAKAGGVPTGDPQTAYYKAENQASLNAALMTIASKTIGCVFQLQSRPPNPDELYVYFDKKTKILRDPQHKTGWDYDAAKNQVIFYGQTCDDLRAGRVVAVDIVYGCDAPPLG